VDAVLEIGGQDAKFIAFEGGAPVDYAMNEGCSAGTGSFLEEAVGTDLGFPVEAISEVAESSERPLSFGERCAAYINSESRCALHHGSETRDVVAGMVYSIAKNYLSRVVGARRIGANVLFQGGVALNRSVGLALASLLERTIVVPRHPELMGCVGAALLARDRLRDGSLEKTSYDLVRIEEARIEEDSAFRCAGCDSGCVVRRISLGGDQVFPFGGACTLHERSRSLRRAAPRGTDLVARRNAIVFEGAERSRGPDTARGTAGVPRCLTAYTYFPFYRALLAGMGYHVVLSEVSADGVGASRATTCHPCEIAHGAVHDLVERRVDHLFVPQVIDGPTRPDALHSYLCWNTAGIARSTGAAVPGAAERTLAPTFGFSEALRGATSREVREMARRLGVSRCTAEHALHDAHAAQRDAMERCRVLGRAALEDPGRPLVILCGRPYVVCADDLNKGLPAMIAERGYDVVSSDMLPPREGAVHARDVWHHTHHVENAVAHALARPHTYVVLVSTFSCAPDAMMSHVLRERLGDSVFCYLEIDAHTASAGFETRVEAFLDIVDEAERRRAAHPGPGFHGATRCPGRRTGELAT
jgi:predicted nucleotide-binding protein (sugar kinase/HSP70/actin superfamily)